MTLKNLLKSVIVQGDVYISVWEDDEEVEVHTFESADNLLVDVTSSKLNHLLGLKIKYMFSPIPSDGYLHIELDLM